MRAWRMLGRRTWNRLGTFDEPPSPKFKILLAAGNYLDVMSNREILQSPLPSVCCTKPLWRATGLDHIAEDMNSRCTGEAVTL